MKCKIAGLLCVPVLALGLLPWLGAAESDGAQGKFNAGFTVLRYSEGEGGEPGSPLTVAVWYPTKEAERPDTYGDGTFSHFAYHSRGDSRSGPYPLVVFSHGYGGSGIGSIFLCEYLTRHGFVVAAPDHSDDHTAMRIDGPTGTDIGEYLRSAGELARSGKDFDRSAHAYRTRELSCTIDKMLEENEKKGSILEGIIDPDVIGAAGHSLGGYTVLAVSGLVEGAKDERIKAALLLSGGVFMFTSEEFSRLEVPIMFMYGEREANRFRARFANPKAIDTRRAYLACNPPKFLLEMRSANHFSFGQVVFSNGLIGSGPGLGAKIASVIEIYGLAFFDRYLLNNAGAESVLSQARPMLTRFEFDTGHGGEPLRP